MIKNLQVEIDKSTWPSNGLPKFPNKFHYKPKNVPINITSTLLLIGHLTTPTHSAGMSLSEFWAWIRYFYAISPTSDLRLAPAYSELDAHQKTILSDDFGMGFPISWLMAPLGLTQICDGRFFIDRYKALLGLPPSKPKKRGPTKCPDFVCLGQGKKWHVVECKGTQSGAKARNAQLSHNDSSGSPSGGVIQKTMIVLKPAHQGQRLACGLAISYENAPDPSSLRIVDPESDDRLDLSANDMSIALDPVIRCSVARALRSAGLIHTASVIAAPSGADASSRAFVEPRNQYREVERLETVQIKRDLALEELARARQRNARRLRRDNFWGHSAEFNLPHALKIDGTHYSRVKVKQGIRKDILEKLSENVLDDNLITDTAPWLMQELSRLDMSDDASSARLEIGDIFASEIQFLK